MMSVPAVSIEEESGEILEKCGELRVEWKIPDFISLVENREIFHSPSFILSQAKWHIAFEPQIQIANDDDPRVHFFLRREKYIDRPPKSVNFHFGIQTAEGEIENFQDLSWRFENGSSGDTVVEIMRMSLLHERMSDLIHSDVFTLTCTLRVHDNLDSATMLSTLSREIDEMIITDWPDRDVVLRVQGGCFSVHKFVLEARSPTLAAMIQYPETEGDSKAFINLEDCNISEFYEFVGYLYSGRFENLSTDDIHLHLYRISDKYDARELKSACVNSMMSNLSIENVCDVLILGDEFEETGLIAKAQDFFNQNFGKIVCTEKWANFMQWNYSLANRLLNEIAPKIEIINCYILDRT